MQQKRLIGWFLTFFFFFSGTSALPVWADVTLPAYLKRVPESETLFLDARFIPTRQQIWVLGLQVKDTSLQEKLHNIRLEVVEKESGRVLNCLTVNPDFKGLPIPVAMESGKAYQLQGILLDSQGRQLATTLGQTRKPFQDLTSGRYMVAGMLRNAHLPNWVQNYPVAYDTLTFESWPFENNQLGLEDRVLPGFEEVHWNNNCFSCAGRNYQFNDFGLPQQISARQPEPTVGEEVENLLAAPMQLHFISNGQSLPVQVTQPIQCQTKGKSFLELNSSVGLPGLKVHLRQHLEQDGTVLLQVHMIPETKICLDAFYLDIPLRSEAMTLMHDISDVSYRRQNRQKTGLEAGIGGQAGFIPEYWCSLDTEKKELEGGFQPFVWLGNEDRGFGFYADSDEGWNQGKIEIIRRDGDVLLRVSFFGTTTELDGPRQLSFGYLATPVKLPFPRWRGSVFVRWSTLDRTFYDNLKNLRKFYMVGWGDPAFNAGEASPLPLNWEATRKQYQDFRDAKGSTCFEYQCSDFMTLDVPEMIKYFSEWVNNRSQGWFRKLYPGHNEAACSWFPINRTVASLQDYKVYCVDRKLRELGPFAFYEDNCHPRVFSDPVWNQGYLPPGEHTLRPEFGMTSFKTYLRRVASVYAKHDSDNLLGVHASATMLLPSFTYASFFIDGEQPARYVHSEERDYIDVWPELEYIRAHIMGRAFGMNSIFMAEITYKGTDPDGRHTRALLALMLPHDIAIWDGSMKNRDAVKKWHQIKDEFDFYGQACRLYPYWGRGRHQVACCGQERVLTTLWQRDQRNLLVLLSNLGENQTVELQLQLDKLGMEGKKLHCLDAENRQPVSLQNIQLPRHDYRVIRIEAE